MAYVATSAYDLGASPAMPNLNIETEGPIGGYSDAHGVYDCDLTAFLVDYLTHPVRGSGFAGTIQTLTGTSNTVQAYCMSLGLLASPLEDTQRAATDAVKETLQIMNCECFVSVGQLNIKPLGDQPVSGTTPDGVNWSWTPDFTPVFELTDDDYCPQEGDAPVKLSQKRLNETHNSLNLTYSDRSNFYNQAPVNASLKDDIALTGQRQMTGVTLKQITSAQVALTVATLILRADRYETNTYEFRTDQSKSIAEPLDYIALNESRLGLSGQVCRVLDVDEDAEGYLTFRVLKIPGVIRTTAQYNWNAAAGYFANYATAPGSVLAPTIFQMPPIAQSLNEGITLGIAVAPSAASTFWLGCNVYMSIDGGSTYVLVGTINSPSKYGTTTASIAVGSADPDITNTLAIALSDTNLQLSTAVTHAEADSMQTLVLVGTGSTAEVMSFGAASLISAGNYHLTYLHRGLYGSKNQAHASAVPFVRLDGNLFQIAIDPGFAGQTLKFKFTSFNLWGAAVEDISTVTAYSYTVPSANVIGGELVLLPRGSAGHLIGKNRGSGIIYKVAGSATAWDTDAVSQQPYTQVSLSAQYATGTLLVGLEASTATVGNSSPDYGIICNSGSSVQISEFGTVKATLSAPATGDLYNIVYDGFTIKYFVNGVLIWETPKAGLSLFAYVAFNTPGAEVTNVAADYGMAATPSQWVAGPSCIVNDTNASKVSGSTAFDSLSWIASLEGYATCHITTKINAVASNNVMVGLTNAANISTIRSNNGSPGNTLYTLLQYAWDSFSGHWEIWESGVNQFVGDRPTTDDVVWISYDGANVKYFLNDPTTPVRTVALAGSFLFGAACFNDVGAGINSLRFAPGANLALIDTGQVGQNAATDTVVNTNSGSFGNGSSGNLCSVAVGPYPWPVTVVLTATGAIDSTGTNPINIQYYIIASSSPTTETLTGSGATPSQTTLAREETATLAANTTTTYNLHISSSSGLNGATVSATLKAEVIKR